jgi:hypothetical protein
MTLEEALLLIPTHIMLRPKIDKWREGDEVVVIGLSVVGLLSKVHSQEWEPCDERDIGRLLLEKQIGRRPIPESVRQAMAMRLFGMSYMDNTDYINDQMRTETAFEYWLLPARGT